MSYQLRLSRQSFEFIFLMMIILVMSLGIIGCGDDDISMDYGICLVEVDGIFVEVELDEGPEYLDGGKEGFLANTYKILKYPAIARENGTEGTCILNYEITEEGKVENAIIIQDPGDETGDAALQTLLEITEGVSFSAAVLDGRSVRVKKELDIKFKIEG